MSSHSGKASCELLYFVHVYVNLSEQVMAETETETVAVCVCMRMRTGACPSMCTCWRAVKSIGAYPFFTFYLLCFPLLLVGSVRQSKLTHVSF